MPGRGHPSSLLSNPPGGPVLEGSGERSCDVSPRDESWRPTEPVKHQSERWQVNFLKHVNLYVSQSRYILRRTMASKLCSCWRMLLRLPVRQTWQSTRHTRCTVYLNKCPDEPALSAPLPPETHACRAISYGTSISRWPAA